uniref:Integrase catalytic domain-containing protein n=1 Tax=Micrurus spixii TaxID=129469 RepID=A0A2D4LMW4_9SAUR
MPPIPTGLGLEFVHQINKHLVEALGVKWHQYCSFHPQSSRKSERANRTIKPIITKFCLETHLSWVEVLPMALYAMRTIPQTSLKLSPFELLYDCVIYTDPGVSRLGT